MMIMIKNAIFRQMKIMVLDKSRHTYDYRFTVMIIKNVIFTIIKNVIIKKV